MDGPIFDFIILAYKNLKNNPNRNSSTQVKQCSSSVEYKLVVVNSDPINDILAKTNMECTVLLWRTVFLMWSTMLLPYLNPDSKNMRQK